MSLTLRGRAAAAAQGTPPDPTDARKQLTDTVIGYIPAETLAMTIALFSVVSSRNGRWAILAGGLVVTPIWLLFNYAKTIKRRPRVSKWPWAPILEATVAYPAWFCTMSGNPIASTDNGLKILVAAGAALTALGALRVVIKKLG